MAHASAAFSNSNSQKFDVFINHRGPDVKLTFATALYRSLNSRGLRAFLDTSEMPVGQDIESQIRAAIEVASVHVAIFSRGYAESNWCLLELQLMIKSRAAIIPVFYEDVKPKDLRKTGKDEPGKYAKDLHKLENQYDIQTVQDWRNALFHAADIRGLELATFKGGVLELLPHVVETVMKKVPKPPLYVATYPTGLRLKVKDLEALAVKAKLTPDGQAKVVGIVGCGGVGKTTVAKQFFNDMGPLYSGSSFLRDVAKTPLNSLQSKLIKNLTGIEIKIEIPEEGLGELNKNLSNCKALIVLDNVDHGDQLDAFLPITRVLHRDSLLLVTSCNKQILRNGEIKEPLIYHLNVLNENHSRELFCSHAFHHSHTTPEFKDVVDGFLETCQGLPLSLKVLGALVYEKKKSYWQELLNGLAQTLPLGIEKSLRVSYDSLEDEEKKIFLDIACFSVGEESDKWMKIWGASGWKGLVGLETLQDKCLVEVDSENIIRMHDHLQLMGRNIAQERSMPVRIWCGTPENVHELLEQSLDVIPEVRGIRMAPQSEESRSKLEKVLNSDEVFRIKKLQLLEGEGDFVEGMLTKVKVRSSNLISLRWNNCSFSSLPRWIPMRHLTVLKVDGTKLERLWDSDSQAPEQLRQLIIDAPLLEFPESLEKLQYLEKIVVKSTCLTKLPDSLGDLKNLEHISLVGCENLEMIPDSLGKLTNLQHMNLSLCKSLRLLPDPMEKLTSLKFLNIDSFRSLEKLPDSLLKSTDLHCIPTIRYYDHDGLHIDLSGFRSLKMLPDSLWDLISLAETINLTGCESLKLLPDLGKKSAYLSHINLRMCKSLEMLPESFGNLTYLRGIDLTGCESLKMLPDCFENLRYLRQINLEMCKSLEMLPESFGNLTCLGGIDLTGCESLKMLPDCFENFRYLRQINLEMCKSLEMLPNSLTNLQHLKCLLLKGCCSLTISTETLGNVTGLKCLDLSGCPQMELLPPQVGRQQSLKNLNLFDTNLKELPRDVLSLRNLEVLRFGSPLLKEVPASLGHLTTLEELWFHGCEELKVLPDSIERLTQLRRLDIRKCGIQYLPPAVMKMNKLRRLAVHSCPLRELPFGNVQVKNEMLQLQVLQLNGTEISEVSFPDGVCPNLRHLSIAFCNDLVKVGALPTTLISLDLRGCPASMIRGGLFGRVPNLRKLNMWGCNSIQVEELPGLQTLISSGLTLLNTPLDISDWKKDDVLLEKLCTCSFW